MAEQGALHGALPQLAAWSKWQTIAALGLPVAAYLAWRSMTAIDWFAAPLRDTDFDSFLVKPGEHPTGLGPRRKASTHKKGSHGMRRSVATADRGRVSGPFETFLKSEPAQDDSEAEGDGDEDGRDPLDFSSFLKSAQKGGAAAAKPAGSNGPAAGKMRDDVPQDAGPSPQHVRILVLFGTEYGFSKEIAEKLCDRLRKAEGGAKYWPVLEDMADHPQGYGLSSEQAVFLACSTQGDGVPPTEAREFCDWLLAGGAGALPSLRFSVCAQGDKSYQHFCRCGKQLDAALEAAGAQRLVPRQDVNKEDIPAVDAWIAAVLAALPGLSLTPIGADSVAAGAKLATAAPAAKPWGKSRPYPACVMAVQPLCTVASRHDKNTVRLELDLGDSGLVYLPGDALGLYPFNAPQYVEELLSVWGADPGEGVPTPVWHYEWSHALGGAGGKPATLSLRDALTMCYDLKNPKAELFDRLWQVVPHDTRQAAEAAVDRDATGGDVQLLKSDQHASSTKGQSNGHANGQTNGHTNGHTNGNGLIKAAAQDGEVAAAVELARLVAPSKAQEQYLASGRHLVDILRQFSSAARKLSTAQVLGALRQLQPRLYSISSAPEEHPTRVQATIAEVRYAAHGSDRIGVCSTFVSERIKVGQEVAAYIHRNPDFRLPPSPATPVIMVGPGTGLAPFRSFILHRLITCGRVDPGGHPITPGPTSEVSAVGEMVLFFGCRRPDQDFLYGADMEAWAAAGLLTLHTAFSRTQAGKVYVQDRLLEQGTAVWKLLDAAGAHFYVCGDASSMAGAVEAALLQVIGQGLVSTGRAVEGDDAATKAQAYLDSLSSTGRYQRDVWY